MVGSSNINKSGPLMSAAATPRRCCKPCKYVLNRVAVLQETDPIERGVNALLGQARVAPHHPAGFPGRTGTGRRGLLHNRVHTEQVLGIARRSPGTTAEPEVEWTSRGVSKG